MARHRRRRRARVQAGFTLIELLVVILIIGVLIALLLPAITGAVGSARDAQVTAEITNLATALEDFKSKYGEYPPSRIALVEDGNYLSVSVPDSPIYPANSGIVDISLNALKARTLRAMKKFFPRATHFQGAGVAPIDWNRSGGTIQPSPGGVVILQGEECLVFFLGGIVEQSADGTFGATGFAKNPLNPFLLPMATGGANRQPPMFEFRGERLVDPDGNGYPGYLDPLAAGKFYAYFSAYGSGGYDPNDCNFPRPGGTLMPDETNPMHSEGFIRQFQVKFNVGGAGGVQVAASPAPNPYTSGPSVGAAGQSVTYHKNESFQIISAGRDGLYGPGGRYSAGDTERLPDDGATITAAPPGGNRQQERDNLTNFAAGRLD